MTQPPHPPDFPPIDPVSGQPPTAPIPAGPPPSGPPPAGPPPSGPPPAAPPSTATTNQGLGTIDARAVAARVLTGNWIGSAVVAALILTTAGLLSIVLGLIAKPPDFGVGNTLSLGAVILAGAFGADLVVRGEPESFGDEKFDLGLSVGAFPLTITILSLVVGVLAFRRMVAGYPNPWPAIGDAVRVAIFTAVPLLIISLVFRSDFDELGRGWFATAARDLLFGGDPTWGANAPGAFFISLCLVAFVLLLTCAARRDWWTGRARAIVEWVAPPLHGLAAFTVLLPISGLIGVGLLMFGNDRVDEDVEAGDTGAAWAAIVAFLANGGFALLGIGSGAPAGTAERERGDEGDSSSSDWHRLGYLTGDGGDEPALWAAPVVLLLVLAASAWVVARASQQAHVLRNLLCWTGSLLVFLPIVARLANGHASVEVESGNEEYETSGVMGVEGVQTTILITLIALLVAIAVAYARGGIDKEALGKLRNLQTNAGRSESTVSNGPPPPPPTAELPTTPPPTAPPASPPPPPGPT